MQIEIGRYYVNKTWKYLLPCVKAYGPTFTAKFNCLFKLAVGIHDSVFDGTDKFKDKKVIYILFDKKNKPHIAENVLEWFRYQKFLLADYPVGNVETTRKHMLIIEIPEMFHEAYEYFLQGKYSLMYNETDIKYLFEYSDKAVLDVLNRTDEGYKEFIKKVEDSFGTIITKSDLIGAELDFPIEKIKEIFNYEEK